MFRLYRFSRPKVVRANNTVRDWLNINKTHRSGLFNHTQRNIVFQVRTEKESLYKILKVKPAATQDEIKKAYYALAKKWHPDFYKGDSDGSEFKRIQKAYEVLSNPHSRQTYDIENRFNEDLSVDIKDEVYARKLGRKNYYVTRQMKDFYHTQWTDYKKPSWYHPYGGHDVRSQYLYRKKNDERAWFVPPYIDIFLDWWEVNRIYIYFLLFFLGDLYRLYKNYKLKQSDDLEMELLQSSFSLDFLSDDDDDDNVVIFNEENMTDEDKKLTTRLALNDYINQRIKANASPPKLPMEEAKE